jgi:hypothetical protein
MSPMRNKFLILTSFILLLKSVPVFSQGVHKEYIQEYPGSVVGPFFISTQQIGLKIAKDEGGIKTTVEQGKVSVESSSNSGKAFIGYRF